MSSWTCSFISVNINQIARAHSIDESSELIQLDLVVLVVSVNLKDQVCNLLLGDVGVEPVDDCMKLCTIDTAISVSINQIEKSLDVGFSWLEWKNGPTNLLSESIKEVSLMQAEDCSPIGISADDDVTHKK